jgi:hypothetical protein
VNGDVEALAIGPSGELFVGGNFTEAGGQPASGVAKWDGATWSPLGAGVDLFVNALAIGPSGELFAGGDFSQAGGQPANNVAKFVPPTCDIEITGVDVTDETCDGDEDGSITINATCTTCTGILYSIDGGASTQTSPLFENLPDGTYMPYVEDSGDDTCNDSDAATVMMGDPLPANPVAVQMSSEFCSNSGVGNGQKRARIEAPAGANEGTVWILTDAPAGSQFDSQEPLEFMEGATNSEFRITGGSKGNTVTMRGEPDNGGTPVYGTWTFDVRVEDSNTGCSSGTETGYFITAFENPAAPVADVTTKSLCPDPDLSPSLPNTGVSVANTLNVDETVIWILTGAPIGSGLTVGTEYTSTGCASGFNNYGLLAVANSSRVIRIQDPGSAAPGDYTFEALVEDCNTGCRSVAIDGFTITVINDTDPPVANCPSPASGPNILTNPSFETNDGNNTPFGLPHGYFPFGPVFALDAAANGSATSDGTFFLKMFGGVSGIFQDHPVSPGDNVTATVDVINASFDPMLAGCRGLVKVEFLDMNGVEISETEGNIVPHTIPLNTAVQSTVYAVAPAGAVTVRYVAVMLCDAGGAVFFDNASLQVSSGDVGGEFIFSNDPDACGAIFDFTIPEPGDNCSATSMADIAPGSLFDVGTTTVTVTATDGVGNTSQCTFDVTVNDTQAPVANCPEPPVAGGNLLENGSFETNDGFDQPFLNAGWTGFDVASAIRVSDGRTGTAPQDGSWYLKMFGGNTGIFQDVPVTVGETLNASVYLLNAPFDPMLPGCEGFLKLEFINSAGGIFGVQESARLDNTTPQNVWTEITLSGITVPAGAVAVRMVVIMQCSAGGAVFYDNASLTSDAPPSPGDFTITPIAGACEATVEFTLPDPGDNCPGAFASASPASGSVLPVGVNTITVTATDASGNTSACTVNVTVEDTEMPMPVCLDATVIFNGQSAIGVPIAQLYDAVNSSDNCGTVNLVSPTTDPIVTCEQVGEVIDVPVVVNDGNGNENTCTATITVGGLPCGWVDNGGIDCAGSSSDFDAGASTFSLTAGVCAPAFPYVSDATSFVFTELCGDGEIIARVDGITGGQGFAGVMMRDSEAPGAPKVSIGTNTINRVRKEVRVQANAPAFPQAVLAFDQFWVRITRTGPSFRAFASADGVQWFPYIFQNIQMGDCIKVGLFAYNEKANSPITATFSNVSVNGVPVGAVGGSSTTTFLDQDWGGFEQSVPAPSISLYPNPARELVNLNLTQVMGEPATIRIFNINGQLMDQLRFDAIEEATSGDRYSKATGRYLFCQCTDDKYVSVTALCEAVGYSSGTRSFNFANRYAQ